MNFSGLVGPESPMWTAALALVRHDTYHLPGYVELEARRLDGRPAAFIHRRADEAMIIPLVLSPVPGEPALLDATSPYGYPGPVASEDSCPFWRESLRLLRSHLRSAGVVTCFLRLHPLLPGCPSELESAGTVLRHGETVSLDLSLDDETGTRLMRTNHRRDITRSRKLGHRVEHDRWEHYEHFAAQYHQTMARVGASPEYFFDRAYLDKLREVTDAHLMTVVDGDEPIAGGLFFVSSGIVEYHLGAVADGAVGSNPMKLVIAETARWGRARGERVLHLGGGLHGRSDGSLFHFKAGFSPDRHCFSSLRMVVDPDVYASLCERVRPAGHDADFFPLHRLPGR